MNSEDMKKEEQKGTAPAEEKAAAEDLREKASETEASGCAAEEGTLCGEEAAACGQEGDQNPQTDGSCAAEEKAAGEKRGFFKKKKDPRDEKIEELTDRVKRQMAEFENFRKRTEKEKSTMYEMGARDMIEKILPVIDNFERGLATIPEDAKESPFAEGMEKIYKQLQKTMEDAGVKVIEAVGKEFDPNLHNAVMHVEDESFGENVVAEELLKGYTYRDSVVRHSMVKVAN